MLESSQAKLDGYIDTGARSPCRQSADAWDWHGIRRNLLPGLLHRRECLLRRRQIAGLQGLSKLIQGLPERVLRAPDVTVMGFSARAHHADRERRERLPGSCKVARLQRLSDGV